MPMGNYGKMGGKMDGKAKGSKKPAAAKYDKKEMPMGMAKTGKSKKK